MYVSVNDDYSTKSIYVRLAIKRLLSKNRFKWVMVGEHKTLKKEITEEDFLEEMFTIFEKINEKGLKI